jgi:hypothetical protein
VFIPTPAPHPTSYIDADLDQNSYPDANLGPSLKLCQVNN